DAPTLVGQAPTTVIGGEAAAQATATTPPTEPPAATQPPAGGEATQPAAPQGAGFGETLETIQSRGNLICAVNGQLPGFSFLDPEGNYAGFDADFCRAVAAAVFGDPEAVEFRSTNTQERFTVLQTGEVDVLIRNTTWSLARDTELGLNFTGTTFYDGQGIMVPADSGIASLSDLEGGTICVQRGTTTELNLADVMATEGVTYTPAVFDDVNATYGAYAEGRCDAVTSDKSQLSSVARGVLPDPDAHIILDATLSKEPLGPAVRHGDDQWFDIVRWTVYATIAAEEYGITSENVMEMVNTSENPEVRRLLGVEGELGSRLGLSNDFAVNVISSVGNYGEIYERNLGEESPTFIPRGLNSQYTEGGLLYSPPFR
ncbi:MAG TPA: amino acid ABC transporter substrate-binding protein, partial [Anaerolineaceae bacterium]|nr:amino acid ABC transporter substrate-binding protein [Anaerolineaceae bacterium]